MELDELRQQTEQLLETVRQQRAAEIFLPDMSETGIRQMQENGDVFAEWLNRTAELQEQIERQRMALSGGIGETDAAIQAVMRGDSAGSDAELQRLFAQRSALSEMLRRTDSAQHTLQSSTERIQETAGELAHRMEELRIRQIRMNGLKNTFRRAAAGSARLGFSAVKSIEKEVNAKVNPVEKKINRSSTADTGIESLRLANSTVKTVKSTVSTARTAADTAKKVVQAPQTVYRAVRDTVNAVKAVTNATVTVVSNVAAFLLHPVVLLLAVVVLMLIFCGVLMIQAASITETEDTQVVGGAYMLMIGVGDISLRYPDAKSYYQIACNANQSDFNALIDGMHCDYSDLPHSDLIYMEQNRDGAVTKYEKGFVSDEYKAVLKTAWDIPVSEKQAAAIAYVYLEMQENLANGTEVQIYDVAFTQDVFDTVVNTAVVWNVTDYPGQQCPDADCSAEDLPNPAYQTALDAYNEAVDRYNDWGANVCPRANDYRSLLDTYNSLPPAGKAAMQATLDAAWTALNDAVSNWYAVYGYRGWTINGDIGDNALAWLGDEVTAAESVLNSTPPTISNPAATCFLQHTLHAVGLYEYAADTVMNALGFSEPYQQWAYMELSGLEASGM